MATEATKHFIGVYVEILKYLEDKQRYSAFKQIDKLAEKCLSFEEYTDYYKITSDITDIFLNKNNPLREQIIKGAIELINKKR